MSTYYERNQEKVKAQVAAYRAAGRRIRFNWRQDGLLRATCPGVGFVLEMAPPHDPNAQRAAEQRARSALLAMGRRLGIRD